MLPLSLKPGVTDLGQNEIVRFIFIVFLEVPKLFVDKNVSPWERVHEVDFILNVLCGLFFGAECGLDLLYPFFIQIVLIKLILVPLIICK